MSLLPSASRTIAVSGPVRPGEAWDRYELISRWPSWALPIRRVEASTARLEVGTTGIVHAYAGLQIQFDVTAVDHGRRTWSWRVQAGPLALTLDHEVLARPHGGSVTTLTVHGPAPVALAYAEVARLALFRLVH